MSNFYSQFGEDQWLIENLDLPLTGTFCEVGAYDGRAGSNTLHFEEEGWTGILVEPDPELAELCRKNRRSAVVCAAVAQFPGFEKFRVNPQDRGTSGLARPATGIEIVVPTVPLLEIFKYLGRVPDLLSIDTEGTELDCWKSIGENRPAIVIMEYLTLGQPPRDKEIIERMTQDGYQCAHRTEANLILLRS